ncbi:11756_t:CDS:2, partial [Entrophospora sp. SA101]
MSAIITKIVEKYNLSSETSVADLSQYTSEFLENLTDDRKRNQARRRLRDGFKFSSEQVPDGCQIPDPTPQKFEETIGDMAQRILQDKLSIRDVRAEAHALALSAKNPNAGSSRLSRLRRELKNLSAPSEIIDATKFPNITKEANEIQQNRCKFVEAFKRIDYPDHFTLESVKERLDKYDISTPPDLHALADVMIMLCIRPAELITLRITDAGVTGYAKNRGQPDIPQKFRSMEKDRERAKEFLTWIQNAISSGRMGNPGKPGAKWFNRFLKDYDLIPRHLRKLGAVYGAVVHKAGNPGHIMTIAGECLHHNPDNHTSPVQNYVIVNYRKIGQSTEQARPFRLYDDVKSSSLEDSDPDVDEDSDASIISSPISGFTISSNWRREIEILLCDICLTILDTITVVLDSGANCNIIGKSLVDDLGLEIDYPHIESEKSPHILGFPILGMFHEINPSFQSKDNKSKQVKVTDVFVTNKPELESVMTLGQPWLQENAIKLDFPNKTLTLLDGTDIQLVIGPRIYIDHLNIILTGPTDIQKFRLGILRQEESSIMEYYTKVKKCGKLAGYNEVQLKYHFLRGLSRDNQLEARRCGTDLSLDELIAKLSV